MQTADSIQIQAASFVVIVWRLGYSGHDTIWYGNTMTEALQAIKQALSEEGHPIEVHPTETDTVIAMAGSLRATVLRLRPA